MFHPLTICSSANQVYLPALLYFETFKLAFESFLIYQSNFRYDIFLTSSIYSFRLAKEKIRQRNKTQLNSDLGEERSVQCTENMNWQSTKYILVKPLLSHLRVLSSSKGCCVTDIFICNEIDLEKFQFDHCCREENKCDLLNFLSFWI